MNDNRGETLEPLDRRLVAVRPHPRQVAHQQLEFYGFIHFGINTFTDREWGDGKENPALFNPASLDANQWAEAAKGAGMTGLILTCKHHDGFCLWPSAYTSHSVTASPFQGGRGDILRDLSVACQQQGLKFGVYVSPWDRNSPLYGQGKAYNDFFVNQLTEVLTNYGEVFSLWLDGACGEGANGKVQQYDWDRYYQVIRALQPSANISVCGPDVRWCGNEAGHTRESEWSVVPRRLARAETVEARSQREDTGEFRQRQLRSEDCDLGSRQVLADEMDLIWYPAEVNTSIRPGWFYHKKEDRKVRSLEELRNIYLRSVGGNATFLLNITPDRRGLIPEGDVATLKAFGDFVRLFSGENQAEQGTVTASVWEPGHEIEKALIPGYGEHFKTPDGVREARVAIAWESPRSVRYIVLQENILEGQRIEGFSLWGADGEGKTPRLLQKGTTVGYKRIIALDGSPLTSIEIRIEDARVCPALAYIGVY